jgi:predicted dehydrogenase/nucleoside-diphosphate-sugar epimerase
MPSPEPVSSRRLRLVVVGCGAVTRNSLLPVLAGHDRIEIVALVDRDVARARELADAYGISRIHDDASAVGASEADAAVVATPPAHHAPATLDFIARGWHVFVEKPMATATRDAEAMVAAADAAGRVVSVGLYRRLLPVARLLRGLVEAEVFGRPVSVDLEEGGEYTWQLATLSVLTKAGGGGGVLIDIGTHLIDQAHLLVPGEWRVTSYTDNARGGIETDCEARFTIDSRWGAVPARLELSRTRDLRGTIRVQCEHALLELVRGDFYRVHVVPSSASARDVVSGSDRPFVLKAEWSDEAEAIGYKAFRDEFDDWLQAIRSGQPPALSGRSVVPVVKAIEDCYSAPAPLREPWADEGLDAAALGGGKAPAIAGTTRPRVLVTGAGGFLGCRTVELLQAMDRWDVRALVRRPASAARLARWPLEIAIGDVTSREDMAKASAGCDAVVHCAVGTTWPPETAFKTTVDGTKVAADAALAAGVRRFVHVSSMAVHGVTVPARLDESVPLDPGSGVDYGRAKYLAEQAVLDAGGKGLNAVILRPARIYGPFSRTFTTRPLTALRSGRLVLQGDANTPSNMVYVDNVVESILRALDAPVEIGGEAFLISEPDQLSWKAFYDYFAEASRATVHVTPASSGGEESNPGWIRRWVQGGKEIAFSPEVRALAKKVMWTDPFGVWPRRMWEASPGLQRRVLGAMGVDQLVTYREAPPPPPFEVTFRVDPTLVAFDKAAARLGYRGLVPRARAMALTLEWARYARLV